jgi:hypothetical protein
MEDVTRFQTIVASLSPLATLLMTGMLPAAEAYAPLSAANDVAVLVTGVYSGFGFLVVQIALLGWRWQRLRRRLR